MAIWQWSKTSIANQTADPTINWSEGQAPSTVNDSARAMMARIAEWRDDNSALLSLTGGPVNFTITTNQGLPNPPNAGQLLSFNPNSGNGANPTISADGGTAFPIQSSSGVPLASGTLIPGTPYSVSFISNAWVLFGAVNNPSLVPLGGIILWTNSVSLPNSSYAWPNGQAVPRTGATAPLFSLIGTFYGAGDGSTTFNIPNLNGLAIFALDGMGGSTVRGTISAVNGNWNGASSGAPYYGAGGNVGTETRTISINNLPSHQHNAFIYDPQHFHAIPWAANTAVINTTPGGNPASGGGQSQNSVPPNTSSASTGVGVNSTSSPLSADNKTSAVGSGLAMPTMPPGISLPFAMRII